MVERAREEERQFRHQEEGDQEEPKGRRGVSCSLPEPTTTTAAAATAAAAGGEREAMGETRVEGVIRRGNSREVVVATEEFAFL